MTSTPESKDYTELNSNIENKDLATNIKHETLNSLGNLNAELANSIVGNPENIEQVKAFPNLWESLSSRQKSEFTSRLTEDIKNSIKELKNLGIERVYSPEITDNDTEQIANLEFVRANKEKIPQLWSNLEKKADEIAKEMGKEIEEKGVLDTSTK